MSIFLDDLPTSPTISELDIMNVNSLEADIQYDTSSLDMDPLHPVLLDLSLFDYEESQRIERMAMKVYRMAVVHQSTTAPLSAAQTVACVEDMKNQLTLCDKIDAIKAHFPGICNVWTKDDVVWTEVSKGIRMSHDDTLECMTHKSCTLGDELHVICQNHSFAKKDSISFVMTHNSNQFLDITHSFLQLEHYMFFVENASKKPSTIMPTVEKMENILFDTHKRLFGDSYMMKPHVAKAAFDTLRTAIDNKQFKEATSLYTAQKTANDDVAKNKTASLSPVAKWNYIMTFFKVMCRASRDMALKAWKLFCLAVSTKQPFYVLCHTVGPLNNSYAPCGVTVDTVEMSLVANVFEQDMEKVLANVRKRKKKRKQLTDIAFTCSIVFAAFYRHVDCVTDIMSPFSGHVFGVVDLDNRIPQPKPFSRKHCSARDQHPAKKKAKKNSTSGAKAACKRRKGGVRFTISNSTILSKERI